MTKERIAIYKILLKQLRTMLSYPIISTDPIVNIYLYILTLFYKRAGVSNQSWYSKYSDSASTVTVSGFYFISSGTQISDSMSGEWGTTGKCRRKQNCWEKHTREEWEPERTDISKGCWEFSGRLPPHTHTHILKQRGWFTMHVYMFVCVFVLSCMYRNCDARWDVWLNLGLGSSDDVVVEGGAHSCPVMSQHKWNNVTWRSVPVSSAPVLCLFQMCWGRVGPRTSTLNLLKEAHCALGIILITAKIIFQQSLDIGRV